MYTQKEYLTALKQVYMTPKQNGGNDETHGYCIEPKSSRTRPNATRSESIVVK